MVFYSYVPSVKYSYELLEMLLLTKSTVLSGGQFGIACRPIGKDLQMQVCINLTSLSHAHHLALEQKNNPHPTTTHGALVHIASMNRIHCFCFLSVIKRVFRNFQ